MLLTRRERWIFNNRWVILTLIIHWLGAPLFLPWYSEATLAVWSERLGKGPYQKRLISAVRLDPEIYRLQIRPFYQLSYHGPQASFWSISLKIISIDSTLWSVLLQLRSHLNEIMLDQLPILADLHQYLERLSMMDPPPAKRDLVLEQVLETSSNKTYPICMVGVWSHTSDVVAAKNYAPRLIQISISPSSLNHRM